MEQLKLKMASLQRKDMILGLKQERLMIKGLRKDKDYSVQIAELQVKRAKVKKKFRKAEEKYQQAMFQEGMMILFHQM